MNATTILKILAIVLAAFIPAPFLGRYLAKVYRGDRHFLSFLAPIERAFYKIAGIDEKQDMGWKDYLAALLVFNALGLVLLVLILMTQAWLPLNPQRFPNLSWHLALNTAISFVTNTNWQSYSGETSLSYFSQMLGLAVQNFASCATGAAVALAFARAFARPTGRKQPFGAIEEPGAAPKSDTTPRGNTTLKNGAAEAPERRREPAAFRPSRLGNFWVDLVRTTIYVLLPLSLVVALFLVSQGVPQNFSHYAAATTLEGKATLVPMGPAASQIAIKQVGSNGGGFFGVNSAHPFENPTPLSNFVELVAILLLPAAFPFLFGEIVGKRKQGMALFGAMALLLIVGLIATVAAESAPNPALGGLPALEGKETRFGIVDTAVWSAFTTAVSNGSVNGMLASGSPILVLVATFFITLGEVVFGGVGAGVYGILLFAIISVFIAGLMVGRGPELLGRKIESREVQLAMLGVIAPNFIILVFSAIALVIPSARASILNAGPRGFTEVLYAFASAAGNNGSALAGLATNTPFYNTMMGLGMLVGRYCVIWPALAIAGSLAAKRPIPESAGTFRTDTVSFALLLCAIVVIVGGLTFFPALALGPIAEHFLAASGRLF